MAARRCSVVPVRSAGRSSCFPGWTTAGRGTVERVKLARRLQGELSAKAMLYWKDVVETLENALNKFEDVSDVVEGIVLKHA